MEVRGDFVAGDIVEIVDTSNAIIARGLARVDARQAAAAAGKKSVELPDDVPTELVHRDDLSVF